MSSLRTFKTLFSSISTLKATFEPLDDGVIAYAFGRNNDNAIIIKVDPARWSNASIEKKWYILYHETWS